MHRFLCLVAITIVATTSAASAQTEAGRPHNVVLFVPDGLRFRMVDDTTAPTMAALARDGVTLRNSHSLFPTFTTANASAFATGHMLGDTGDFSNTIYAGFEVPAAGTTVTPFLENDPVLGDVDEHFSGNYLDEATILKLARDKGYSTASIGKVGPALIFDHTERTGEADHHRRRRDRQRQRHPAVGGNDRAAQGGEPAADLPAARRQPKSRHAHAQHRAAGIFCRGGDQSDPAAVPGTRPAVHSGLLVARSRRHAACSRRQPQFAGARHQRPDFAGGDPQRRRRSWRKSARRCATSGSSTPPTSSWPPTMASPPSRRRAEQARPSRPSSPTRPKANCRSVSSRSILAQALRPAADRSGRRLQSRGAGRAHQTWQRAHRRRQSQSENRRRRQRRVGLDLSAGWRQSDSAQARVIDTLLTQDYVSGIFVDARLGKFPGTLALDDIALDGGAVTPHPAIVDQLPVVRHGLRRAGALRRRSRRHHPATGPRHARLVQPRRHLEFHGHAGAGLQIALRRSGAGRATPTSAARSRN